MRRRYKGDQGPRRAARLLRELQRIHPNFQHAGWLPADRSIAPTGQLPVFELAPPVRPAARAKAG